MIKFSDIYKEDEKGFYITTTKYIPVLSTEEAIIEFDKILKDLQNKEVVTKCLSGNEFNKFRSDIEASLSGAINFAGIILHEYYSLREVLTKAQEEKEVLESVLAKYIAKDTTIANKVIEMEKDGCID